MFAIATKQFFAVIVDISSSGKSRKEVARNRAILNTGSKKWKPLNRKRS